MVERIQQSMNLTTIKKFNLVIFLWLIVVLVTLAIFGHELGNYGCYIAAAVVGAIVVLMNAGVLISGLIAPAVREKRVSKQYN